MKQYTVRYGHVYKIIVAIVGLSLSIVPFIWLMHLYVKVNDWQTYVIIFSFLAVLFLFILWVVLRIYPKATLYINENEISLSFTEYSFLKPDDFSVKIKDITYLTPLKITGNDSVVFITKNPSRKFRLSAPSYNSLEYEEFNMAMTEIREMVNSVKEE
jgi:hypothetical protein